jgi:outer membrane protein TolC
MKTHAKKGDAALFRAGMPARKRAASPFLVLVVVAVSGCLPAAQQVCNNVILPEQRTIDYHDPAPLPSVRIPDVPPPRTVTSPRADTPEWRLSLDDAIRIALENGQVIRVLAGVSAVSSGQTIYDTAITNTTIDQAQARFDPTFTQDNLWSRTNTPNATFDPLRPLHTLITSQPTESYQSTVGLTKTNVLGGQCALNYIENPLLFTGAGRGNNVMLGNTFAAFPLNPQQTHTVQLSYTQPLLQGGGFAVNMAPIVIARLNTEQSYFQYKDAVQSMVLGVIQAYWNLVQARTVLWARRIQLELSEETFRREEARLKTGLGNRANEAQARTTYNQFRASVIAAEADVLTQEGALRNILGIPPEDNRRIVPTSAPTERRLAPNWDALVRLGEQRRPDIVELKLIVEADKQRLVQAQDTALPRLDATARYQWNGLSGTTPLGDRLSTAPGQFGDWAVGINFSVPLGLRQGRAAVREQKLLITRDVANVEQSVLFAVHQLAATVRDLDSEYDQYQAFKDTRAAALDNVQVQIGNQRVGFVNYLNVLQALNDWGSAVASEAQQLLAYNVALATLERETGTILETHGLVFNEERFRAAGPIPHHCQLYPEALVPAGAPQGYPGTDAPSEDVFDLKKPEWRDRPPEKPMERPEQAPPPRAVPPEKAPPADKPTTLRPTSSPAPPARFPDLLLWPPAPAK